MITMPKIAAKTDARFTFSPDSSLARVTVFCPGARHVIRTFNQGIRPNMAEKLCQNALTQTKFKKGTCAITRNSHLNSEIIGKIVRKQNITQT